MKKGLTGTYTKKLLKVDIFFNKFRNLALGRFSIQSDFTLVGRRFLSGVFWEVITRQGKGILCSAFLLLHCCYCLFCLSGIWDLDTWWLRRSTFFNCIVTLVSFVVILDFIICGCCCIWSWPCAWWSWWRSEAAWAMGPNKVSTCGIFNSTIIKWKNVIFKVTTFQVLVVTSVNSCFI